MMKTNLVTLASLFTVLLLQPALGYAIDGGLELQLLKQLRDNEQCGHQVGGKECPNGLCCSKWGFCGDSEIYCREGCQSNCDHYWKCGKDHGDRLCPMDLCCSRWGWCGKTPAYCGEGCQSQCNQPSYWMWFLPTYTNGTM